MVEAGTTTVEGLFHGSVPVIGLVRFLYSVSVFPVTVGLTAQ